MDRRWFTYPEEPLPTVRILEDGTVLIEHRYPYPHVEQTTIEKLLNELRGEFLEKAIEEMRRTGKPYAVVRCPCCGRRVRITIEEVKRG